MIKAHITGFVFFFKKKIWADEYIYLKNLLHFDWGKMHFLFGSSKSKHLICWVLENSFFGPAVCLAITIP